MPQFDDANAQSRLDELQEKEAEDLAQILSERYGLTYIDLTRFSINTDALRLIPEDVARNAGFAAFNLVGREVGAAVISPRNEKVDPILNRLSEQGYKVELYIASRNSLERAWSRYSEVVESNRVSAGLIDISRDVFDEYLVMFKNIDQVSDEITKVISENKTNKHGVSKIVELVLAAAIAIGASDIHVEPKEERVRVRMRLDGVLHDIADLNHDTYKLMLSRIKLVSGLVLNVKSVSQDGRFTIRAGDRDVEIRTGLTPGSFGESFVLRLLDASTIQVDLSTLGMEPYFYKTVMHEIEKPNGMILVTGPTGSGKTTSLYAFMRHINHPEIKVITIEDPIEYHMEGIEQTQIDRSKGYDFNAGLLSSLRHDPDVIMVGEIRDQETATTAINAALTGHLVFSTLHTNDATGAIPRLIDLKVNYRVLGAAINIAIAQRLVRRLCDACKKEAQPDTATRAILEKGLAGIKQKRDEYDELVVSNIYNPVGCSICNKTGYKGRVGIFEAIVIDESADTVITDSPSMSELADLQARQGMLTMAEDGILKIVTGISSLEEVTRVANLDTLKRTIQKDPA
ncbi:MAG: type II/IV secretion system protein [bacterium]|nr:type II/IV secretion system protein [bacterium]